MMEGDEDIQLTIHHHGTTHILPFPRDATLVDLSSTVTTNLSIPQSNQKFMITPKPGLLKPPFPTLPLSTLTSKKILLLGSTATEIASINLPPPSHSSRARRHSRPPATAKPSRHRDWKRAQEEALYTFTTLRPLPYLPNPSRSLRMLERLRDDAGIKATMRKHQWTVPLLTEMDPAQHTTHDGKTLGLNRNGGEVIELRLRTDAYDGYRDYKGVRKTLCHELTHNVFSEHDAKFWALCKQLEKEVETADWRSGGRALTDEEFYNPHDDLDQGGDEGDHVDHGAWTGGEYVLGGAPAPSSSAASPTTVTATTAPPLSRRDILARAAEARMRVRRWGDGPASAPDSDADGAGSSGHPSDS
ncbi:MAG: hypothetical protein M1838_003854 [Thelocarpon superellum]|nr:MAG: hypothetical protein M1838_003854 [Thelocarpon superellum]